MIEIINDFSNLIQIIVVVLIFGGERYYEYHFRKKELIKEWYYKIFIDPNLEKIELFFKSVKEEFEKSQQHLKSISYHIHVLLMILLKRWLLQMENFRKINEILKVRLYTQYLMVIKIYRKN